MLANCEVETTLMDTVLNTKLFQVVVYPKKAEHYHVKALKGLGQCIVIPSYLFQVAKSIDLNTVLHWVEHVLLDPVAERYVVLTSENNVLESGFFNQFSSFKTIVQKNYLPSVTDNLANSLYDAIALVDSEFDKQTVDIATGELLLIPRLEEKIDEYEMIAKLKHQFYNPLVQQVKFHPFTQNAIELPRFPIVQLISQPNAPEVNLDITDHALIDLSQKHCLALSLEELKTIQQYYKQPQVIEYRKKNNLPFWPTNVELEALAQTWSEHCKHKIFNAKIQYEDHAFAEYGVLEEEIDSLFKTYIAGPTEQLRAKRPDLLSVFKDNAGVVSFNDDLAICFKVETHNSPSALEPYGGALTGILGVNRDILGTGLGAEPIANTDVFCFAHPEQRLISHPYFLPAEAICEGVRKGVEDGGNKSGIPTVNGAVFFDARYRAKPLVFCGTVGVLPKIVANKIAYEKHTQAGDAIIMVGGRVGKDGIHGATFSSVVLDENSPVSAVQIGDPLTQKRVLDFILAARDKGLITGITDNGAGGLSSSVGEMAELTNGAKLFLEKVPLKYAGLQPFEILVSESQERMTVSTNQVDAFLSLAKSFDVEATVIGEFTNNGYFDVYYDDQIVASFDLDFLHNGLPQLNLKAVWDPEKIEIIVGAPPDTPEEIILDLLKHPNICSREPVIRQFDHEVQGRSIQKSLCGPQGIGPSDAAVILPNRNSTEGLVISNGLYPQIGDWDAYHMAACAVDEAIRNAVAVGCDPQSITLLDNFCWPDPIQSARNFMGEYKLAQLVRACKALSDSALAFETPFISGKDSMKNDFDDGSLRISIPPTVLISATGKLPDVSKTVSMPFKNSGDKIYVLGQTQVLMGGSHYYQLMGWQARYCPQVNFAANKKLYQQLHQAIMAGVVNSCHDVSDGGMAITVAECMIASGLGARLEFDALSEDSPEVRWDELLFSESVGRFVVSVKPEHVESFENYFLGSHCLYLGEVTDSPTLNIDTVMGPTIELSLQALKQAWLRSPVSCWAWEFDADA